jgi:hypothetical protein
VRVREISTSKLYCFQHLYLSTFVSFVFSIFFILDVSQVNRAQKLFSTLRDFFFREKHRSDSFIQDFYKLVNSRMNSIIVINRHKYTNSYILLCNII